MPITQSAKKALRQSLKHRNRNLEKKRAYLDLIRKTKKLILESKIKDVEKLIPQIYKALDKAAKTHAIKKNKAARLKSRLAKMVKKKV